MTNAFAGTLSLLAAIAVFIISILFKVALFQTFIRAFIALIVFYLLGKYIGYSFIKITDDVADEISKKKQKVVQPEIKPAEKKDKKKGE